MITYLIGDATVPISSGPKVIVHVCNDVGAWGLGFVMALSRKWPAVEDDYRRWSRYKDPAPGLAAFPPFDLGHVRYFQVAHDLWVGSMLAQCGIVSYDPADKTPPIRYEALEACLRNVATFGASSVHMPRIGCGLAGGTWDKVEPIIIRTLGDLPTYVYDLP